jgi:hypothetical protein
MAARVAASDLHVLGGAFALEQGQLTHAFSYVHSGDAARRGALGYGHVLGGDSVRLSQLGCEP